MPRYDLTHKLLKYAEGDVLPMHMPGHKRSERFVHLTPLSVKCDITEIDGFDDLNCPEGVFLESERLAARLWGSEETVYSVNGSSGCILASVRCALKCKTGKKVLLCRASHKSVYHALELCGARSVYLKQRLTSFGFCASADPEEVRRALEAESDIALVVITSPTYEGVISDVETIARICHERGVPLMVDEAHGAHLGLHGVFPVGAVKSGADLVVQSLHKTLPCLTQTALVHVSGSLVDKTELRRQMSIFQTSSPSYLLSASVDGAVRLLASDEGRGILKTWYESLVCTRECLSGLENIRLFEKCDGIFDYDPSKFVLSGEGRKLSEYFRREHKIELEMASPEYVIAMTGAGDTAETLSRFEKAVKCADNFFLTPRENNIYTEIFVPEMKLTFSEAVTRESECCDLEEAIGRVSAGYVYAYPPGVPIVAAGEVIDGAAVRQIKSLSEAGFSLRGVKNGKVSVLKD